MKPKVLVTGIIAKECLEILKEVCDIEVNMEERLLTKAELIEKIKNKDALLPLLSDKIDADIINAGSKLKVIANFGAGFNNIDVEYATKKGIAVSNTPAVSTETTADLTFGIILDVARRITEGDREARAGNFEGWAPMYHLGVDVYGKTLGIIGFGNIGQAVAKRAAGFDMKVMYTSRTRKSLEIEAKYNATYASLEEVIKQADFLTCHLSYTPELKHLMNAEKFAMMKSTAYFINGARGPVHDEEALVQALKEKQIAGAALDVFELEPQIHSELLTMDNVVLTPHIGNASIETRTAMGNIAVDNILSVLKGQKAPTVINPSVYSLSAS